MQNIFYFYLLEFCVSSTPRDDSNVIPRVLIVGRSYKNASASASSLAYSPAACFSYLLPGVCCATCRYCMEPFAASVFAALLVLLLFYGAGIVPRPQEFCSADFWLPVRSRRPPSDACAENPDEGYRAGRDTAFAADLWCQSKDEALISFLLTRRCLYFVLTSFYGPRNQTKPNESNPSNLQHTFTIWAHNQMLGCREATTGF